MCLVMNTFTGMNCSKGYPDAYRQGLAGLAASCELAKLLWDLHDGMHP
jgi:hypothetical protein